MNNFKRIIVLVISAILPCLIAAGGGVSYSRHSVKYKWRERRFFTDLNEDDLKDIVINSEKAIAVYYQSRQKPYFPESPSLTVKIPPNVLAYDFDKSTESDRLMLVTMHTKFIQFNSITEKGEIKPEKTLNLTYPFEEFDEYNSKNINFYRDVNEDGKKDLLVPHTDRFDLFLGDDFGTSPTLSIPLREKSIISFRSMPYAFHGRGVMYQRLGRSKVAGFYPPHQMWYHYREFIYSTPIHIKKENGQVAFHSGEKKYIIDSESQKVVQTEKQKRKKEKESSKKNEKKEENRFEDFNAFRIDFNRDGLTDMYQIETETSMFSPKTRVQVFLAEEEGEFPARPDFKIITRAISPPYQEDPIRDINGDGYPDLMLLDMDFKGGSLESNLKGFFRGGLDAELQFYLWNPGKGYSKKPDFEFSVLLQSRIIDFYGWVPGEFYKTGQDFTGDGKPDLLIKTSENAYHLHAFINNDKGFSETSTYTFPVSRYANEIETMNLNNDGIPDLRFHVHNYKEQFFLDILYVSDAF